jgi:hypothetical protein
LSASVIMAGERDNCKTKVRTARHSERSRGIPL